jgi:regulator of sigma D
MSIENDIDSKSLEILEASKTLDTILEERYKLEKQVIEISEAARKGRYLLARLK